TGNCGQAGPCHPGGQHPDPSAVVSLPADPGPHSLRYFYTAVSEAGPGLPQFTVVGYLDDQLFFHFDSEGKVAQPRAPWIQAEGPEYWARQTWIAKGWQEAFNGNVRIAMERYNQSRGLHTFQYTYGCQLRADGSAGGFRQYGYDGRDFLSYDTRTHTWVAPSKEAEITKGKMEADRHLSQQQRDYLERKCVEWLQKYLGYGKETLQRRERPAVRVTGRDAPGGPTTLWCRAHGFYPQDITLIWLQNGGRRKQEKWRGGVLPNGDGTYYAWATVKIDPQERGLYHCHVEHESLAEPFVAVWEPPSHSALLPALIGAVAVTALLTGGAVGFVLWRKRCSGNGGLVVPDLGEPPVTVRLRWGPGGGSNADPCVSLCDCPAGGWARGPAGGCCWAIARDGGARDRADGAGSLCCLPYARLPLGH
uniref:Ig-like domain-containing protein n=1 Tax=Chelonoidis abingdonii TaxID=106734 RepID=A0A8C0GNU3_CHEAB